MASSQRSAGPVNPIFPGGAPALQRFVDQTRRPLSVATSGTVFVEFVVNADGSVGNCIVRKGINTEADLEAVRIVASMPAWTPGTVDGEPARYKFILPIDFTAGI
ncbi:MULTISPECIES: energy transducer TonB [Spirosoma]|uniref:Energy transducer TonB n=1 Tax=Spirosoma sordidisoli TaxID=2502893 RepID=A0A4Q2UNL3_9BACT|nr:MULTISPECIES: energy transducer TonB [Spirosoma]RYC69180.1 energy transducer TonB [Spirosoma sordidisoli]